MNQSDCRNHERWLSEKKTARQPLGIVTRPNSESNSQPVEKHGMTWPVEAVEVKNFSRQVLASVVHGVVFGVITLW